MNAPVIPERRKPLTRKQRSDAHDTHGGICCVCQFPIAKGEPFIDEHIIPLALGGSNDANNRGMAHRQCAARKTKVDVSKTAKAVRIRAKHLGIPKRKGPPMPGSRASGWKKPFYGKAVRR